MVVALAQHLRTQSLNRTAVRSILDVHEPETLSASALFESGDDQREKEDESWKRQLL